MKDNKYFDSKLYNISYGIEKLSKIINDLDNETIDLMNINSMMELYNVYKVLADKNYLKDKDLQKFNSRSSKIESIINNYINSLSHSKICNDLKIIDLIYKIDYIELLIKRKVYKKVDKSLAYAFFDALNCYPYEYLKCKDFVEYFSNEIKRRIISTNLFAEIFIDLNYNERQEKIFLPKLTDTETKNTLNRYIKDKNSNPRYLEKICNIKHFNKYELTQYEAYEKKEKIFSDIFKNKSGESITVELRSGDTLNNDIEHKDHKILLTYNTKDLKNHLDYPTLLNNFIYLFDFVNCFTMNCNLVYKSSEDGIIDKIYNDKGQYIYLTNYYFKIKELVSYVQLVFYLDFLLDNKININDIIRWFFNDYINEEFGIKGFEVSISDSPISYFEKCKDLVSIFDEIKKQYYMWAKYKYLDRKFIERYKKRIRFCDIPSINKEHYYYNESIDIKKEINMLFSDQSMLFYIERSKSKYSSLYCLLLKEKIRLDDFYEFQKEHIEWLIERKTLIEIDGIVKLNIHKVLLLKLLYEDEVIVLTKFNKESIIEVLPNAKYEIVNSLLTKKEGEYFDYYLNDRYSNGNYIRNKYSHPPASKDENVCKQDYYAIIKLIIILIIKINDDLCTYNDKNNKIHDN